MRLKYAGALAVIVLALWLGAPLSIQAAVVGSLIQAQGSVEILKQGKLPAVSAKVRDRVEPGDVIRTKSGARAQVRFIDDTVLTIAPSSMVAVESYLFDSPKGVRRAVLQIFRGLVSCVVSRLLEAEQPTFLMKTHTALLGVRGTEWYTLLGANYTAAFTVIGPLEVGSIQREITKKVVLMGEETSTVAYNQPPTEPVRYPDAMRRLLESWLRRGVPGYIITVDPRQAPWLRRQIPQPQFPEMMEEFPEGLFVPPIPRPSPQPISPGPQ